MATSLVQPILALLGDPVQGNPTQYMIEQALAHHGLDWRYLSLEVSPEGLGDAVRGMRAMGFGGGNCFAPHKQAILPLLDRLSETAQCTGAVNCILRDESGLVGENTEGRAVVEMLRRRIDPAGKAIVLLGAGKIARSIAVELAAAGPAQFTVVNRSEEAGRALVELLGGRTQAPVSLVVWQEPFVVPPETGILIHATSADPEEPLPLDLEGLTAQAVLADVSINPPQTWFLREGTAQGYGCVDGLEIFIEQTAINFKLWTGIDPDRSVLREAIEEFLEL